MAEHDTLTMKETLDAVAKALEAIHRLKLTGTEQVLMVQHELNHAIAAKRFAAVKENDNG